MSLKHSEIDNNPEQAIGSHVVDSVQMQEDSIEREARGFVAAFNDGSLMEARFQRWRQLLGEVQLKRISKGLDGRPVAWLRGEISRGWIGVQIRLDSATALLNRNAAPVFWTGGGPPASLLGKPSKVRDDAHVTDSLRAYFTSMARLDLFSGVVIVSRGNNILFEGAFGMAHQQSHLPNTMGTRFALASVGKVFTAVAVLRLVQEGKLSLTDTVGAYIPDYPVPEARRARIDQLLTHTAGLGDSDLDWIAMREDRSLAQLVRVALPRWLGEGAGPQYNNEAFLIAGRIVEIAAGESYESWVRRCIFGPAKMRATGWDRIDEDVQNRAVPYSNLQFISGGGQQFVPGPRRDVTSMQGLRGTPAGGAVSTAGDLLRFADALLSRQLLDDQHTRQLLTVEARTPIGLAYAYGFEMSEWEPVRAGKGGNAQGSSAQFDLYLSEDVRVVLLSNFDGASQVAAQGIREILGLSVLR